MGGWEVLLGLKLISTQVVVKVEVGVLLGKNQVEMFPSLLNDQSFVSLLTLLKNIFSSTKKGMKHPIIKGAPRKVMIMNILVAI